VRGKGARNETRAPKNGDTVFVVLVFESSRDNFRTRRDRNDSRREWNVDLSEVLSATASEHSGCVWVWVGCAPCLRALPFGLAGSNIAEMQHSPSRATNPESLRVNRDFKSRERLREDIRGHIFCGTVLDVDFVVGVMFRIGLTIVLLTSHVCVTA
jgi:hypothetical protein